MLTQLAGYLSLLFLASRLVGAQQGGDATRQVVLVTGALAVPVAVALARRRPGWRRRLAAAAGLAPLLAGAGLGAGYPVALPVLALEAVALALVVVLERGLPGPRRAALDAACAGGVVLAVFAAACAVWGALARVERLESAAAGERYAVLLRTRALRLAGGERDRVRWAEVYRLGEGPPALDVERTRALAGAIAEAGGAEGARVTLHGGRVAVQGTRATELLDLDRGAIVHRQGEEGQLQLLGAAGLVLAGAEDASWRTWTLRLLALDTGAEVLRQPHADRWSVRGGRLVLRVGADLRVVEPDPWRLVARVAAGGAVPLGASRAGFLATTEDGRRLLYFAQEGERFDREEVQMGTLDLGGERRKRLLALDDRAAFLADGRDVGPFGLQAAELAPEERLYVMDVATRSVRAVLAAQPFHPPRGCAVEAARVDDGPAVPARAVALVRCSDGSRSLAVVPDLHRAAWRDDPAGAFRVPLPAGAWSLRDLAVVRWERGEVTVLLARASGAATWSQRGGLRRLAGGGDPREATARLRALGEAFLEFLRTGA